MSAPAPTPRMTRPSEMWSSEATCLASTIGSRSITKQIPVLSMIRFGYGRVAASATKGVMCVRVFLGSSAPPGNAVRRLTGICVCSLKNIESRPRSSTALAKSTTERP